MPAAAGARHHSKFPRLRPASAASPPPQASSNTPHSPATETRRACNMPWVPTRHAPESSQGWGLAASFPPAKPGWSVVPASRLSPFPRPRRPAPPRRAQAGSRAAAGNRAAPGRPERPDPGRSPLSPPERPARPGRDGGPAPATHRQLLLPLHQLGQLPPGVWDLRRRRLVVHRHVGLQRRRRRRRATGRRTLRATAAGRQGARRHCACARGFRDAGVLRARKQALEWCWIVCRRSCFPGSTVSL